MRSSRFLLPFVALLLRVPAAPALGDGGIGFLDEGSRGVRRRKETADD